MTALDTARALIARIDGRAEASAHVTAGSAGLTRFANSFIHQNVSEHGHKVVLTVARAGSAATAEGVSIDEPALDRLVDKALAAIDVQPEDPDWPGFAAPDVVTPVDHHDAATADAAPDVRAGVVAGFVAARPEKTAAGYCETVGHEVAYVNTSGHETAGRYTKATFNGIHRTATSAGMAHHGSNAVGELDGVALGARAAHAAERGVDPIDVEPGSYEVVLGPEAVATLVTFVAQYGFNAKAVAEASSFVKAGETRFDQRFSLVDDPLDRRALGVPFDIEGTPSRRLALVEDGVAVELLHDRRTAARVGATSTGHAVAGGEIWGPSPRALFVRSGESSPTDLIADVENGLYVTAFNYCRVLEPKSLVVTGLTRYGVHAIRNGELAEPVGNLRFTQAFPAALAPGAVLGVGSDGRHADSEFGPGVVHAPSLRLGSWRFTGGASG